MGVSFRKINKKWFFIVCALLAITIGGWFVVSTSWPLSTKKTASTPPSPQPSVTTQPVIFSDPFNGANRTLVSAQKNCETATENWEITNGTFFIQNSAGYSGKGDESANDCPTPQTAGSQIFRMHTKKDDFRNITIDFDFKLEGKYLKNAHSYDGLHIWVHHESQYALYAVSVARWDGHITIKKKLPTNEQSCEEAANQGCYADLTTQVSMPDITTLHSWRHGKIIASETDGIMKISLFIDGKKIIEAQDDGTQFGRIISRGAVGIRADNTEFYLKNFTVSGN